jgi:hypothetical protein
MRTSAHAAKTRASAHAAEMASCHAAGMHASSHAPHAAGVHTTTSHAAASTTHAAATTAASERRRCNSKRGAKRARHQAPKDLVVHPNSPWLKTQRRKPSQKEKQPAEPNDPARTNYKCDSF